MDEVPLMCQPSLAVKIGLNEALFIQQLHYWLTSSKVVRDGKHWVYNTVDEWNKQFPFWSKATLKRTIASLEKMGLIQSANYNRISIDRTKWYTIDYEALCALETKNENSNKPIIERTRSDIEAHKRVKAGLRGGMMAGGLGAGGTFLPGDPLSTGVYSYFTGFLAEAVNTLF